MEKNKCSGNMADTSRSVPLIWGIIGLNCNTYSYYNISSVEAILCNLWGLNMLQNAIFFSKLVRNFETFDSLRVSFSRCG